MLFRTVTYQLPIDRWPVGSRLRLGLVSDLHNNITPGLLARIRESAPDLVIVAGDMNSYDIFRKHYTFGRAFAFLAELAEVCPVFYAFGNHETRWRCRGGAESESFLAYRSALEQKGIRFLDNTSVLPSFPDTPLRLTGLELPQEHYAHYLWKKPADFPEVTEALLEELLGRCPADPPQTLQLLIAHHPYPFAVYRAWGAELIFSGHLHGGVFRLPFAGGLVGPGFRLFPPYSRGLYEEDGCRMLVSAGLGTHTVPFRLFNPREYLSVELTGKGKMTSMKSTKEEADGTGSFRETEQL